MYAHKYDIQMILIKIIPRNDDLFKVISDQDFDIFFCVFFLIFFEFLRSEVFFFSCVGT